MTYQLDQSIDRIVFYCQQRNPEALDQIFDALPQDDEHWSQQVITQTVAQLQPDLEALSWFCGYMASEINCSQDNDRPLTLVELSKTLILAGMEPFLDFVPYIGERLVILNVEKFTALPPMVQTKLRLAFELRGQSGDDFLKLNEAIRQELKPVTRGDCL